MQKKYIDQMAWLTLIVAVLVGIDVLIESYIAFSELITPLVLIVGASALAMVILLRYGSRSGWQLIGLSGVSWASILGYLSYIVLVGANGPKAQLFGQPAEVPFAWMLIAFIGISVCIILFRKAIPIGIRLFLLFAALYSLSSVVLGLLDGQSLVELLASGSFYERLPVWAQGVRFGVYFVLPLIGILFVMLWLQSEERITSFRFLNVAQSAPFVLFPLFSFLIASSSSTTPFKIQPQLVDYENIVRGGFDILRTSYEAMDAELLEPKAVIKRLGNDPIQLLAFVKGSTTLMPYLGSLKGYKGVLADRTGNSLDRSLLLQELLRLAGHESSLAKANLNKQELTALVEQSKILPNIPEMPILPSFDTAGFAKKYSLNEKWLEEQIEYRSPAKMAMERRIKRTEENVERLRYFLDGREDGADEAEYFTNALREHWWVELDVAGDTEYLDPTGVVTSGASIVSKSQRVATVPAKNIHTIAVQVGVTINRAGSMQDEVLVSSIFEARDFVDKTLRVQTLSKLDSQLDSSDVGPSLDTVWTPVILNGLEIIAEKSFSLSGRVLGANDDLALISSSAQFDRISDAERVLDGLSGKISSETDDGESPATLAAAPSRQLEAYWIDYSISSPQKEAQTIRRTLVNRKEIDSNAENAFDRLNTITDVAIQTTAVNEEYLATLTTKILLDQESNVDQLIKMLGSSGSGKTPGPGSYSPIALELLHLAKMRHIGHKSTGNSFIFEPNILTVHSGFYSYGDQRKKFRTFDIVANRVGVRELNGLFGMRLFQGVWDTYAEFDLAHEISGPRDRVLPNAASELGEAPRRVWSFDREKGNGTLLTLHSATTQNRWVVQGDGTTLGYDGRGYGASAAEYLTLKKAILGTAICVGAVVGDRLIKGRGVGIDTMYPALACLVVGIVPFMATEGLVAYGALALAIVAIKFGLDAAELETREFRHSQEEGERRGQERRERANMERQRTDEENQRQLEQDEERLQREWNLQEEFRQREIEQRNIEYPDRLP